MEGESYGPLLAVPIRHRRLARVEAGTPFALAPTHVVSDRRQCRFGAPGQDHPVWVTRQDFRTRLGTGMRTACSVLAVVMLALAPGACGESDEEKAQNTVCDAKADIGEQVDELKAVTPATVTGDDVKQNLDAIQTDLKNIEAAQGDLSSDRRSEAEAANKAFTSSVQGIASQLGSSLSAADAKAGLVTALDQLAASYQKAFAPLDCD
jgi:hypothetical protein